MGFLSNKIWVCIFLGHPGNNVRFPMLWAWNLVCGRFINFRNGRKFLTLLTFGCSTYPLLNFRLQCEQPCLDHFSIAQDQVFLKCFRDRFLGISWWFGSLDLKIRSLESEKIIIGCLESEKIGSLESEKSSPYRSIPCSVPNIFLKKNMLRTFINV